MVCPQWGYASNIAASMCFHADMHQSPVLPNYEILWDTIHIYTPTKRHWCPVSCLKPFLLGYRGRASPPVSLFCSTLAWSAPLRQIQLQRLCKTVSESLACIAFILNSSEVIETSTGVAALHKNAHKQVHLTVVALPRVPPFAHIAEMLGARHRHRCQPAKRPGKAIGKPLKSQWNLENVMKWTMMIYEMNINDHKSSLGIWLPNKNHTSPSRPSSLVHHRLVSRLRHRVPTRVIIHQSWITGWP